MYEQLQKMLPHVFSQMNDEYELLMMMLSWCAKHPEELRGLQGLRTSYPLPVWHGSLASVVPGASIELPYTVVATDGSQIYPDKHQGVPCYVLNTGIAQFSYGETSTVSLSSIPELTTLLEDTITEDVVNCRRAERELEVGLEVAKKITGRNAVLCDGSLIPWHLETKSRLIKERFLSRYIGVQEEYYKARVPLAGYISLPKSKELIAILRAALEHAVGSALNGTLDTVVDTDFVGLFLHERQRTQVFTHRSSAAKEYPDHLRPCFVYYHTGLELARVEMPTWVAQDDQVREQVLGIIQDQADKGNGYPVSLAEAHEQAVIKSFEREQFFALLQKMHLAHNRSMPRSQKSLKKQFVSI